jgi:hypothetical protein
MLFPLSFSISLSPLFVLALHLSFSEQHLLRRCALIAAAVPTVSTSSNGTFSPFPPVLVVLVVAQRVALLVLVMLEVLLVVLVVLVASGGALLVLASGGALLVLVVLASGGALLVLVALGPLSLCRLVSILAAPRLLALGILPGHARTCAACSQCSRS